MPRFSTRVVALAALAALLLGAAGLPPLAGGLGAAAPRGHHHHHHKPPVVPDDVRLVDLKTGPNGDDPLSRLVFVDVSNTGAQTVGPFVLELSANLRGASLPTQTSGAISLGPNASTTVAFPAIGCQWLNAANGATLTATTNPKPVPQETGPTANNTLTLAPNLDFSGHPECSGT
jgi:hypothetical protein